MSTFEIIPGERWKYIPGFPHYAVSCQGRVYSFWGTQRLLGYQATTSKAYRRVKLYSHENKKKYKQVYVHRLVAELFLPPSSLPHVHHKNGNGEDNRWENLEWISAEDNTREKWVRAKAYAALPPVENTAPF